MTSDQTARERIAEVLFDIGEYDEPIAESAHVDRIIAVVVEALTHPRVIAQGDRGCAKPAPVQRVVENVLHAAFGPDYEG